ncbi:NmrA family transcriptional regulator [Amycolatopsis sp. NPDC051903]|uniref:NmrA family transcriptional regulator n=1 Tax=Amycolatopsis sp. NPDC051903 TaxID=3363936 RepID=UPI0037AA728E
MTKTTLVLGGTGKTGRRVTQRLAARGVEVRAVSRGSEPRFDWADETTWAPVLEGVSAVYVTFYPDLVVPWAAPVIREFCARAVTAGAERIVLLSGRGEEDAAVSEGVVRESGAAWTVLRASWFFQNFSEHFFLEPVLAGEIALPAGAVTEPFVDAGDVADIAAEALTTGSLDGQTLELTSPRLLTFADVAAEISAATGRDVRYRPVSPDEFVRLAAEGGVPADEARVLVELFARVLDGRNSHVTGDVERVLGRPARDFGDYARASAAAGVWTR